MRFLIDMPLSPALVSYLRERGHDAVHAFNLGMAQASDRDLMARASEEGRIVVTADTDFPQLLALTSLTCPGVILLRGGTYGSAEVRLLLDKVLGSLSAQDLARSICVVDRRQIRCRPLPLR